MTKTKTHPLIKSSLAISSLSMALYSYRSFSNYETGYGIVFALLFLFLSGLFLHSFTRDRKIHDGL